MLYTAFGGDWPCSVWGTQWNIEYNDLQTTTSETESFHVPAWIIRSANYILADINNNLFVAYSYDHILIDESILGICVRNHKARFKTDKPWPLKIEKL